MLDYKELNTRFEQVMTQFSKEDLENWLVFDAQREMLERLQSGETVTTHHHIKVAKLLDVREAFVYEPSVEDVYILAA